MSDTFQETPRGKWIPGETYRVTVKVNTKYVEWHKPLIVSLLSAADWGFPNLKLHKVGTFLGIEFLHETKITNPNWYFVRVTFDVLNPNPIVGKGGTDTVESIAPPEEVEVFGIDDALVIPIIVGVVFVAIAVTAVLWRIEKLVKQAGVTTKEVLNPWVIIGAVIIYLVMKGVIHA